MQSSVLESPVISPIFFHEVCEVEAGGGLRICQTGVANEDRIHSHLVNRYGHERHGDQNAQYEGYDKDDSHIPAFELFLGYAGGLHPGVTKKKITIPQKSHDHRDEGSKHNIQEINFFHT